MEDLLIVLAATAVSALVIAFCAWHFRSSRRVVEAWARSSGFELLEADRRFLRRGPFWWRNPSHQQVFRVTVRDGRRGTRRGYVCVGGWLTGMFSEKLTVRWD